MPFSFRDWTAAPADLAALARLSSAQHPEAPVSTEDVAHSLAASDPARPFLVRFAVQDGQEVGFVECYPSGPAGEFLLELVVCPAVAGQGLGTELMNHALTWAAGRGARALVLSAREDDPRFNFLERRGFRVVQRFFSWSRDFSEPVERSGLVGLHLRTLAEAPERLEAVRIVLNAGRAAMDLPPFDTEGFETNVLHYGQYRPDLIALAETDDQVVGVAVLLAFDDPGSVECAFIAVNPAWQRRGVGRALIQHACIQARQAGTRTVTAAFQKGQPGAAALALDCGFVREPSWLSLRRALVP